MSDTWRKNTKNPLIQHVVVAIRVGYARLDCILERNPHLNLERAYPSKIMIA
jgi:hypothetical protein